MTQHALDRLILRDWLMIVPVGQELQHGSRRVVVEGANTAVAENELANAGMPAAENPLNSFGATGTIGGRFGQIKIVGQMGGSTGASHSSQRPRRWTAEAVVNAKIFRRSPEAGFEHVFFTNHECIAGAIGNVAEASLGLELGIRRRAGYQPSCGLDNGAGGCDVIQITCVIGYPVPTANRVIGQRSRK